MSHPSADRAEAAEQEFLITRIFDAPRDLVWKAYTEAERLMHWWGPQGFAMRVATLDLRPGGVFHYCVESGGNTIWGMFVYHEIVTPELLVFTSSFADPEGGIVRSPFSPTWPLEIMNWLTFSEYDGRTTLTMRGGPHEATAEEQAAFAAAHDSLQQGFKGTLDQLEAYLARFERGPSSQDELNPAE